MESDVKGLIEKLRNALREQVKIELSMSLFLSKTTAHALVEADSRVQSTEATLTALVKSMIRQKAT